LIFSHLLPGQKLQIVPGTLLVRFPATGGLLPPFFSTWQSCFDSVSPPWSILRMPPLGASSSGGTILGQDTVRPVRQHVLWETADSPFPSIVGFSILTTRNPLTKVRLQGCFSVPGIPLFVCFRDRETPLSSFQVLTFGSSRTFCGQGPTFVLFSSFLQR